MSAATRRWIPLVLGVVLAAAFGRLGMWQLSRLGERRELNRARDRAIRAVPVVVDGSAAMPPTDSLIWRRAVIEGSWDEDHEIVVRGRAWLGSPGVAVLTPLRLPDGRSILVLRGWLPAADGLSADLTRVQSGAVADGVPREVVEVRGLALPGEGPAPVPPRRLRYAVGERIVLGGIDLAAADSLLPGPVSPFYVQVLPAESDDAYATGASRPAGGPVPFPAPELADGPHLFYAFQWFGFAAIALAAGLLLPRAARQGRRPPEPPSSRPCAGPPGHAVGGESP